MRNPLHSICPYFAMFPEQFAEEHIGSQTTRGQYIFDPFSGRGTALFQALLMGRRAIASDINPVAYCISAAKADIPSLSSTLAELDELECQYNSFSLSVLEAERYNLPEFFRRAFYFTTAREILFLRRTLNWRHDPIHRFIATLVLGSLHGEMDKSPSYFSNAMPRTISTKPRYSLEYWKRNKLWPKKKNVFSILRGRAAFRLKGEVPEIRGVVALRDAREAASVFPSLKEKIDAVVTSPPYFDVTSYEEDQWLRLWFLGYQPRPTYRVISRDDRYERKDRYWVFLMNVWSGIAPLLKQKASLVCRMGGRGMTKEELTEALLTSIRTVFPKAYFKQPPTMSNLKRRQTDVFRPGSTGCIFEVDNVICLGRF